MSTDVPDVPRTSIGVLDIVQKMYTRTQSRRCFQKRAEILFDLGVWEANMDKRVILPTMFILHHPSGNTYVANPFFLWMKCVGTWALLFFNRVLI